MVSLRQTIWLTVLALIAFAGNSILARLALIDGAIGAGLFTTIRLVSGAIILFILIRATPSQLKGNWVGALSLLGYAALFSWAYLNLSTGMGALILFAAVQITMIGWGVRSGDRLAPVQILGITVALSGLIWLLLPGLNRPDPIAAIIMLGSGLCWGIYSLLGRGSGNPLFVTAGNFVRAAIMIIPLYAVWFLLGLHEPWSVKGISLAIASGTLTSGLGYAIWYNALKGLTASRAGVVQLSVPPLAALGGIVLLGEALTFRFVGASAIILLGIALAIVTRRA